MNYLSGHQIIELPIFRQLLHLAGARLVGRGGNKVGSGAAGDGAGGSGFFHAQGHKDTRSFRKKEWSVYQEGWFTMKI